MKDYNSYSDEKLISLIKEPKNVCDRAFYTIYQRYSAKLNAYISFKASNSSQIEEVFHTAWIKFYDSAKKGTSIHNVLSYLISIARNLAFDIYRQENSFKSTRIEIQDFDSLDEFPETLDLQGELENCELISLIKFAVDCLDDIYKEAFVLKRIEELPNEEIARLCGENINTVKKRVNRATIMVKNILQPYIKELSDL